MKNRGMEFIEKQKERVQEVGPYHFFSHNPVHTLFSLVDKTDFATSL